MDTRCLKDCIARASRYFFGTVIINAYQPIETWFPIVPNRALLLDKLEAIVLQSSNQLAEFHRTSDSRFLNALGGTIGSAGATPGSTGILPEPTSNANLPAVSSVSIPKPCWTRRDPVGSASRGNAKRFRSRSTATGESSRYSRAGGPGRSRRPTWGGRWSDRRALPGAHRGRYSLLALGPNLETQGIEAAGERQGIPALSVGTREQLSTIFLLLRASVPEDEATPGYPNTPLISIGSDTELGSAGARPRRDLRADKRPPEATWSSTSAAIMGAMIAPERPLLPTCRS